MAITRYTGRTMSPWRDLDTLTNRLNQLFDEPFAGTGGNGTPWMPAVNVEETADVLRLTAELPGMSREDVEIELENNVLTIRGEKSTEHEEGSEERRYHLWERRYGSFQRSFSLPRTVSPEDISAEFADGVLTVVMPKAAEARGRRIEIGGKKEKK